jgi:hypothetical protein
MNKSIIAAALAVSGATLCHAGEVVLFDNLQAGYSPDHGWAVDAGRGISLANPFSSSVNAVLSEVRLSLKPTTLLDQPNFYTVSITDALAGLPGPNTLYQWSNVQGAGLNVLTFASDVPVTPGGSYFVKVEPANQATQGGWFWNASGDSGPFYYTYGGTWHPYDSVRGGMTVKATTGDEVPAVPGPAAAIPFALGLLARRRRR